MLTIEWFLAALERELIETTLVLEIWSELDDIERLDFWAEWPLTLDFMHRIARFASRGQLSSFQQCRVTEVRNAFRRLQPQLQAVMGDDVNIDLARTLDNDVGIDHQRRIGRYG